MHRQGENYRRRELSRDALFFSNWSKLTSANRRCVLVLSLGGAPRELPHRSFTRAPARPAPSWGRLFSFDRGCRLQQRQQAEVPRSKLHHQATRIFRNDIGRCSLPMELAQTIPEIPMNILPVDRALQNLMRRLQTAPRQRAPANGFPGICCNATSTAKKTSTASPWRRWPICKISIGKSTPGTRAVSLLPVPLLLQ